MQEDHLRHDESTTDESGLSTRSDSQGRPNANVDFRIEGGDDISSTDMSDPAVQELVQFLNKRSGSISREIDSALTSTEDSDDDDSFRGSSGAHASSEHSSWDSHRAAEASTLLAAKRAEATTDPKQDINRLSEKVRLLLSDRKVQKETIDAQKAEITELRAALQKQSTPAPASVESLVHQSEVDELKRELAASNQTMAALRSESQDKANAINKLEHRVQGLLQENQDALETIDVQNRKISRLSENQVVVAPSAAEEENRRKSTFDEDFAALDAALGQIDGQQEQTSTARSVEDGGEVAALKAKLAEREEEVASLNSTVKRLEAIAFDRSQDSTNVSDAGDDKGAQVRVLKGTNEEQSRTIQLQKSTIGSLKEEVELLTSQLNEYQNDNQVNVNKQQKVAETQRYQQEELAREAAKLEKDKEQFAQHLREFKDMRRQVLGGAVVSMGGGVSKARYRTLRHKRDKYKRKDYRKGKDVNAMQKRLLQNVELLEVEDSQTSSEGASSYSERSDATTRSTQSSRSVQLVHDTSSEAEEN